MILADTSVWVDHLRHGRGDLSGALLAETVLIHPFVIGELACGQLRRRAQILTDLQALPKAREADHDEVLAFIDAHRLAGTGLGWVDVHLLASAILSRADLHTRDRRLEAAGHRLGVC